MILERRPQDGDHLHEPLPRQADARDRADLDVRQVLGLAADLLRRPDERRPGDLAERQDDLAGLWLVAPLTGTLTLTFMLSAWLLAIGLLELYGAWQAREAPGAWTLAVAGALDDVLGVLIAVNLPSSASWALGLLIGISLVFWGVRALMLASALKDATPVA